MLIIKLKLIFERPDRPNVHCSWLVCTKLSQAGLMILAISALSSAAMLLILNIDSIGVKLEKKHIIIDKNEKLKQQ